MPLIHSPVLSAPLENHIYDRVSCPDHIHPEPEAAICVAGETAVQINGRTYVLTAGECIYVAPFDIHGYTETDGKCQILVFRPEAAPAFFNFVRNRRAEQPRFRMGDALLRLLADSPEGKYGLLAAQGVVSPLCAEIAEKCSFPETRPYHNDLAFVALLYLEKHYTEELTLENVAKEVGCHPASLSRSLRRNSEIGFCDYLNLIRCNHAVMQIGGGSGITDAAYAAGFGSVRNFNRVFRKVYGCSPSSYFSALQTGPEINRTRFV